MGQFNYDRFDVSVLQRWLEKVGSVGFGKVVIRGEFWNQTRIDELRRTLTVTAAAVVGRDENGHHYDYCYDGNGGNDETIVDIRPPPDNTWPFSRRMTQRGFFSPLGNLANVLMENCCCTNNALRTYDGVLYVHDDSIFNVELLAERYLKSKRQRTTTIIGTDLGRPTERGGDMTMKGNDHDGHDDGRGSSTIRLDRSYEDPTIRRGTDENETELQWKYAIKRRSYRIYPKNTTHPWTDIDGGHPTTNFGQLHTEILDDWKVRKRNDGRCMKGQYNLSLDDAAARYFEYDGDEEHGGGDNDNDRSPYLVFPSYTQADFLYVPMQYAKPFYELADLHNKHKVWIECSIPAVVYQLRRLYGASVAVVPLCTSWDPELRGMSKMVHDCINVSGRNFHGFYHPVKASDNISEYERVFDLINGPWIRQNQKQQIQQPVRRL